MFFSDGDQAIYPCEVALILKMGCIEIQKLDYI